MLLGDRQLARVPAVAHLDQQRLEHVQADVLDREQGERLRQNEFAAIGVEGEQRLAELGPHRLERAAAPSRNLLDDGLGPAVATPQHVRPRG